MVAPTICWAPFGTKESAFLMKCTRHLCQLAPVKTASTAPLSPWWASLVTNRTPERPLATKERKKESQKEPSPRWDPPPSPKPPSRQSLPSAQQRSPPPWRPPGHPGEPSHVGGVEPHIGLRTSQLSVAETFHLRVEFLTKL